MIEELTLANLPPSSPQFLEDSRCGNIFVLRTCQRLLQVGFKGLPLTVSTPKALVLNGPPAYRFLLETLCGLKSKIVGENEIVHQFKKAYRELTASPSPNPHLLHILEKLFQDGKSIRRQHLLGIGSPSYGGIVRQIITRQFPAGGAVAITGSGTLASHLIKILPSKYQLHLLARNGERGRQLQKEYSLNLLPWRDFPLVASSFPIVINTIGTEEILFPPMFFQNWAQTRTSHQLMICLGEPSPVADPPKGKSLNLWKLPDIFREGEIQGEATRQKIEAAKRAIDQACQTRCENLALHFPFGFEELQFA